jgi:putative transposase
MKIYKTFKYRLYHNRRNRHLRRQIDIAGLIWNHALALQKRYYRLTGRFIMRNAMQKHIAKLRRRSARYAHWQQLGSQAVQDVCERLDRAYHRFFTYKLDIGEKHLNNIKKWSLFDHS